LKFQEYQEDAKDMNCTLQWCKKHETLFPIVDFLAKHIIRIVGTSQIEIERIFSLAGILMNLKRCHL
jgi:hypothetical protein